MVTEGHVRVLCCGVVGALALAGCGGISMLPGHARPVAAAPNAASAGLGQVAVVKKWSAALEAGDVRTAAGLFHLPSVFVNSGAIVALRTPAEAEAANESLPCGALFISAFRQGRYLNVLFRLVARRGQGGGAAACGSGVGETARTQFLIRDGQILEWIRAPSRPSDPGQPPAPISPATTTAGATV